MATRKAPPESVEGDATQLAVPRERPCGNANFLVDFGGPDSRSARSAAAGFSEVIFPPFLVDAPVVEGAAASLDSCLILKRGVTGNLDLHAWWQQARRGKAPLRRTLKIELLAEDHVTVVLTWRFRNVRPFSLCYSPLHASQGVVLIETMALAFGSVEVS